MTPYLEKSALYPAQIIGLPHPDLGMVVVIPAYDEPALLKSLEAISNCQLPKCAVEVIVVINDSEKDTLALKQRNQKSYEAACHWGRQHSITTLKFHVLYHTNLPARHAGVGLARKIGMDEGIYRLLQVNRPSGLLCCFDADSLCDDNYLVAIEKAFLQQPKLQAVSIYFEHPLEGTAFPQEVYQAITEYELHLRYYIDAQRWAGFPFAQQTIGSSMAVRADAYQKQGGMNRRKAGEDFYFLQKFIELGHFEEIKNTRVIPSPRLSDRVPFGTGKAVADLLKGQKPLLTYAPNAFQDLKVFFTDVPRLFRAKANRQKQLQDHWPESIREFLDLVNYENKLAEIRRNTANSQAFNQRFFRWFNAFLLMKFVHFARDNYYDNIAITDAARWLLKKGFKKRGLIDADEKELLLKFRQLDRQ
ncbi:MAG: hypothetical protein AAF985_17815 [Bacteroidota bacterium]